MSAYSLKCLSFGGTDEYATFGNVLSFERNQSFSFSSWFRCLASASWYILLSKNLSSPFTGYQVTIDSSGCLGLWLEYNDGAGNRLYTRTTASYCDGAWHHCVVTYDGSSLASGVLIYIDGSTASIAYVYDNLTSNIANTAALMLGGRTDGGFCYVGYLDEVAAYDKALTLTEAQWIYNSGLPRSLTASGCPSNLVAWWRMGEGDTYPTVLDQTANNYDGTMMNMETTDFQDVYFTGGLINYTGYSDGKFSSYPGVVGSPTFVSKSFGGRPVMVCTLVGDEVPHYYKMRAQDSGASPPGYVTWMSTFSPDFVGDGYSGGSPVPVGSMVSGSAVVADEWWEGED